LIFGKLSRAGLFSDFYNVQPKFFGLNLLPNTSLLPAFFRLKKR